MITSGKIKHKILFVTAGTKIAPATRYRVYQLLPFLLNSSFEYKVYSIFSDNLTRKMINSSGFSRCNKMICYTQLFIEKFIRGLKVIFIAGKYDVIFLQRATFLFGFEKLLQLRNNNIIFDIDDAIFLPDTQEPGLIGRVKRYIKKQEVVAILKVTKIVIAENNYIGAFVRKYCDKVYMLTGPIDTVRNFSRNNYISSGVVIIGWIGSLSTSMYLNMLDKVFLSLSKKYNIKVKLIGAGNYNIEGVSVENIVWEEKTEVRELHTFDIGIMPMPDNEWTKGKVGCKMLQYMANAIPAVVSHTITTTEVIKDGVNGFTASSEEEWIYKLSRLIENIELRKQIGLEGRRSVEKMYSVEASVPKVIEIMELILSEKKKVKS